MTEKNDSYIEAANCTMSDQWHAGNISRADFIYVLQNAISALEVLDAMKKAIFYGREYPGGSGSGPTIETIDLDVAPIGLGQEESRRLIHGIIGSATEAGEKLEALLTSIDNHSALDVVNLVEEIGDGFWYDAAVLRVAGLHFEDAQNINIEKLRRRFGDKFTAYYANNRNLDAERQVLEDGLNQV